MPLHLVGGAHSLFFLIRVYGAYPVSVYMGPGWPTPMPQSLSMFGCAVKAKSIVFPSMTITRFRDLNISKRISFTVAITKDVLMIRCDSRKWNDIKQPIRTEFQPSSLLKNDNIPVFQNGDLNFTLLRNLHLCTTGENTYHQTKFKEGRDIARGVLGCLWVPICKQPTTWGENDMTIWQVTLMLTQYDPLPLEKSWLHLWGVL